MKKLNILIFIVGIVSLNAYDFNSDGNSDLLWQDNSSKKHYIHFMNDTGGLIGRKFLGMKDYTIAGVSDFNNDGNSDIVWKNNDNKKHYIHFMNDTGGTISKRFLGMKDYTIVDIDDYNDDENSDIVWQKNNDKKHYIYFLDETGKTIKVKFIGMKDYSLISSKNNDIELTNVYTMAVSSGAKHYLSSEDYEDVVQTAPFSMATLTKTLPFNKKMVIDLGLDTCEEEQLLAHKNKYFFYFLNWYNDNGYMILNFKDVNGNILHTFKFNKPSGSHTSAFFEFDGSKHNKQYKNIPYRASIGGYINIENGKLIYIGEYNCDNNAYYSGINSKTWDMLNFNDIKEIEISIGVESTYSASGLTHIPLYIEY